MRGDLGRAIHVAQSCKGLLMSGVAFPLALADLQLIHAYEFVVLVARSKPSLSGPIRHRRGGVKVVLHALQISALQFFDARD